MCTEHLPSSQCLPDVKTLVVSRTSALLKYISRVYIRVCTERPRSSQPTAQSFPEIKSQVLNSFRRTPFACAKRLISTHSYSGSCTHIESHEMRVQNVHQSLSGCQNVCTERHQPRILFTDIKRHVPNVYRPQIAFPDVNTRVQNSHTAFPVVSKQTSTTLIVLPGLEMHVQNVYHRHKAFPDVKTFVQNVYQPHIRFPDIKTRVSRPQISFPDVNTRVQHFSHQHFHKRLTERTSTIVTTFAQNVYQPHICFSRYQNLCPEQLPSSNSFVNTQPFRIPKRMVTTRTSMCVQNVYQPAHCFRISKCVFRTPTDVNTCVQNVYHRHQAFPDVITLLQYVYQTHISFPDVKTRVPSVYLPQIAFPKVNTSTHNYSGCQNERLPP